MAMQKTRYLKSSEEITAITSSVRLRIIQCFRDGDASIAEIAEQMGRSPHSLYHHMRKLVKAEILAPIGVRRKTKRDEIVYGICADNFQVYHDPKSKKSRFSLKKLIAALLRRLGQDLTKSIDQGLIIKNGPKKNTHIIRHDLRLTDKRQKEIQQHLDAITNIISQNERSDEGRPYTFSSLFFPSTE